MDLSEQSPTARPHFDSAELRTPLDSAARDLEARLGDAIEVTRDWLLKRQHPDGHWCAELEGDTILESEYILLLAWLGQEQSPIARKCAAYIVEKQLPTGGWAMYPGGKMEISGSVKAYFALKLAGHDPQADYMQLAREAIRRGGGTDAVNSFTRFYLALLGQLSYEHCPAVPPELVLLPQWSPINIYRMSAWSRTILVPLSIMWAYRPQRSISPDRGVSELFIRDPADWPPLRCPGLTQERGWFCWERFFRTADSCLKWLESRRWTPLRRKALAVAERWMTTRFAHSDGLGAIFPPIIWSVIALKCLGYADDSAEMRYNFDQLNALTIEQQHTARLQPCLSPVWDTALALRALAVSDKERGRESLAGEDHQSPAIDLRQRLPTPLGRATNWLLEKEVTRRGDWAQYAPATPAGWFFEYHNEFYPDVDDTAMVMIALRESQARSAREGEAPAEPTQARSASDGISCGNPLPRRAAAASDRARRWILAMQNRDGGWGAFDRDNDADFLCRVPFADHNAMIDPSTPDLTGRALEALAMWSQKGSGVFGGDALNRHESRFPPNTADPLGLVPAINRGIDFLRRTQERDGSWFGRWGVNYIYGTWQSLVGLAAAGVPADDPMIRRGANWLLSHQHACGGWGESADSYEQPELRGKGPVTASQTAWAVLGLIAAGLQNHRAVQRGIYYLLDTQRPDGGWDELEYTGTGFPRVFYLRYHYYPIYFPLLALSQYRRVQGSGHHRDSGDRRVQKVDTLMSPLLNPEP
jgi:squalene-hopene/tetraprenyl-beta-curcumene cyclase